MPDFSVPKFELIEVGEAQALSQITPWSLNDLQVPEAWKISQGQGVTIAVVDTGIDENHSDLNENLIKEKNKSFHPIETFINDLAGHGTASSGVICCENNEIGVVGVAPEAKVIAIKVLGENGSGPNAAIEQGLKYIWEIRDQIDIVNLSLGSIFPLSNDGYQTIKDLYNYGIVIVAATGNDPSLGVLYPARYDEVFAIGAYTNDVKRDLAEFSANGPAVDFVAPGTKITTTWKGNTYATLNGTSFAAPYFSGVLALFISYLKKVGRKMTVPEIKKVLIDNCVDIPNGGFDEKYGYGIVSPLKLLDSISGVATAQEKPDKPSFLKRLLAWFK